MHMRQSVILLAVFLGSGLPAAGVLGDTVVLKNGDVLNGEVLSLNASELKLKSNTLGQISLAREKVVTIQLGDQPLPPRSTAGAVGQASGAAASSALPGGAELPKADSVDDVLRKMQLGGVDAGTLQGLEDKLPLLATPEVKQYFNEKVTGLMSGTLSVQDIRKDAINARDQILDLQKDLGPQGDAMNPYLSILESFIRKSEPSKAASPEPKEGEKPAADTEAPPKDSSSH